MMLGAHVLYAHAFASTHLHQLCLALCQFIRQKSHPSKGKEYTALWFARACLDTGSGLEMFSDVQCNQMGLLGARARVAQQLSSVTRSMPDQRQHLHALGELLGIADIADLVEHIGFQGPAQHLSAAQMRMMQSRAEASSTAASSLEHSSNPSHE